MILLSLAFAAENNVSRLSVLRALPLVFAFVKPFCVLSLL